MNVVLFTIEGLRYKDVSSFGMSNLNTYIFDSFARQGTCFLNFRLPSPLSLENIQYIKSRFKNNELNGFVYDGSGSVEKSKMFLSNASDERFLYWQDLGTASSSNGSVQDMYINQEKIRASMEAIPEEEMDKTIFILMGSGGFEDSDVNSSVFDSGDLNLRDHCLHAPLIIFHPDLSAKNVSNSVSLEMVANYLSDCSSNKFDSEIANLLSDSTEVNHIRSDIYSHYGDVYGLRGPMFQYFCKVNGSGKIVSQELFDLNNDLKMSNNLVDKQSELSTQVIDLLKTYKSRVCENFLINQGDENV